MVRETLSHEEQDVACAKTKTVTAQLISNSYFAFKLDKVRLGACKLDLSPK